MEVVKPVILENGDFDYREGSSVTVAFWTKIMISTIRVPVRETKSIVSKAGVPQKDTNFSIRILMGEKMLVVMGENAFESREKNLLVVLSERSDYQDFEAKNEIKRFPLGYYSTNLKFFIEILMEENDLVVADETKDRTSWGIIINSRFCIFFGLPVFLFKKKLNELSIEFASQVCNFRWNENWGGHACSYRKTNVSVSR